jgi:hypothetical protein
VPEVSDEPVELEATIKRLKRMIEALEAELSDEQIEGRLESQISRINTNLSIYGKRLELEHSENPLRFDLRRLTVIADAITGPIPMERMGSGSNWIGYHIVVHLALHWLFSRAGRPVPRFVVFDQPSQSYFPAEKDVEGTLEGPDEDRQKVLEMFELIRDVVQELDSDMQVIVTEHADPAVAWYQDSVVARWRKGVKLIPAEWISIEP